MNKTWGIHTKAVQSGTEIEPTDVSPPIHMANTYIFDTAAEAAAAFQSEDRPLYTRWGNTTISAFEAKVAAMEGAESAVATSSGMAAVSAALFANVRGGDHIVATNGVYSGTHHLITEDLSDFGVEFTLVEGEKLQSWEAAIKPNTKVFYLESPGNPTLLLNDIKAISDMAHAHGITVMIDNTFATPINQRPLDLGVDLVIYSATKFFCGHGDALGGAVTGSADMIRKIFAGPIRRMGGCISPFNAWMIARGMSTLPIRMARHHENSMAVADFLDSHPKVAWVRYPLHPSHPQYELATRQMPGGGGGVVVFELKGGVEAGARMLDRVNLIACTVSLGDVRSLITHAASTTHFSLGREERLKAGITDGLVRFAVGIENAEDIIADLDQALARRS